MKTTSPRRAVTPPPAPGARRLPFDTVALVLQGGGALGSYQAGVYQGLAEDGIAPNWIAGISIGALNAAIIAGNPPGACVAPLREFWETICRPAVLMPPADAMQALVDQASAQQRRLYSGFQAWRTMLEGQEGFFKPRGAAPWLGLDQGPTQASFYDTSALKTTLERLVDFDRINAGKVRVSVGAVNVRTGNFGYFDNTRGSAKGKMRPEHFMASGALPPGFPAVDVDGEFYWDGGMVSNTPLAHVLDDSAHRDTLAFQVDLWSAKGPLPKTVFDAQERLKDIQFSSRTRAITSGKRMEAHYRRLLREVLAKVPARQRDSDPWCQEAQALATAHQSSVIHLIYEDKEWEGQAKDYEFSTSTMNEHWATGLKDIRQTLAHPDWLQLPPEGVEFVTHDQHRGRADR